MKKNIIYLPVAFLLMALMISCGKNGEIIPDAEDLAFEAPENSREFFYTNKAYGFFIGETRKINNKPGQGWFSENGPVISDYMLIIDGDTLNRENAAVFYHPEKIMRDYGEVKETLFLADSLDLLFIKLEGVSNSSVTLNLIGFAVDENAVPKLQNGVYGIKGEDGAPLFISAGPAVDTVLINREGISVNLKTGENKIVFSLLTGKKTETGNFAAEYKKRLENKRKRINKVLAENYLNTSEEKLNRALNHSKIAVDAMLPYDERGLVAGLPFGNRVIGRDLFFSFDALLHLNRIDEAKNILLHFAKNQKKDELDPHFGRIPNLITPSGNNYNAADVTPLFVKAVNSYFERTADTTLINELYPVIKRSVQGAINTNVDEEGFYTHYDDETWMDAFSGEGVFTPRGNRAVEIQAFWYGQLRSAQKFAVILKDSLFEKKCAGIKENLEKNFMKKFVNTKKFIVADHINFNGEPDTSLRPNFFMALNESSLFGSYETRLKILGSTVNRLVYPYGVPTLWQGDGYFHPFYRFRPYYIKEEAIHNGLIWQWLSAPVIQALNGFGLEELSWNLYKELIWQITDRGITGSLPEMMEAVKRKNHENILLTGESVKTWSNAAFLSTFYRDYLGLNPDAPGKALYIMPALPDEVTRVNAEYRFGKNVLELEYRFNNDIKRLHIKGKIVPEKIAIGASIINEAGANYQLKTGLSQGDELFIEIPSYAGAEEDLHVLRNGKEVQVNSQLYVDPQENRALYDNISFAQPGFSDTLDIFKGYEFDLLQMESVNEKNEDAELIISSEDDAGDENYSYPLSGYFKEGIADIKSCEIRRDSLNYYFTIKYNKLTDPGWRPELGYQLTFTAICIRNRDRKSYSVSPGYNGKYRLYGNRGYSRLIAVGAGFEISDQENNVLATYFPPETGYLMPIGSAETGIITFAIPKTYLGEITSSSTVTVLSGLQDDYGGAGIGAFREVEREPSFWYGGGKFDKNKHNIYDVLFIN